MPGWHEAVKELREKHELVLLGVTQEQHADRCRLFAQWQQFDWPILHDPINSLELRAVPVAVAIDEHGIVRETRPRASSIASFVARKYQAPGDNVSADKPDVPSIVDLETRTKQSKSPRAWQDLGDALILWGGKDKLDRAVASYQAAVKSNPRDAASHFRLGVAYRMRYESTLRNDEDFLRAVSEWGKALEIDPNQYIFRRRIQQYGPRLDKPYPFYDWVDRAVSDIESRGDSPIQLVFKPSGAEIATPSRQLEKSQTPATSPDPKGKINRDANGLIRINAVVVPSKIQRGKTGRVHLSFRTTNKAHWNNESEPLKVWIESQPGWTIEKQQFESNRPKKAESNEERTVEFEFRAASDANEASSIRGFALYFVCEEADGTCLYLRQDFVIDVQITD